MHRISVRWLAYSCAVIVYEHIGIECRYWYCILVWNSNIDDWAGDLYPDISTKVASVCCSDDVDSAKRFLCILYAYLR